MCLGWVATQPKLYWLVFFLFSIRRWRCVRHKCQLIRAFSPNSRKRRHHPPNSIDAKALRTPIVRLIGSIHDSESQNLSLFAQSLTLYDRCDAHPVRFFHHTFSYLHAKVVAAILPLMACLNSPWHTYTQTLHTHTHTGHEPPNERKSDIGTNVACRYDCIRFTDLLVFCVPFCPSVRLFCVYFHLIIVDF